MEDSDNKITETTKKCAKCLEFKPFQEFNKCKRASLGLHNHCRVCQKQVRRDWYLKNTEQEKKKSAEYSKTEQAKNARKKRWKAEKHIIGPKNNKRRRTENAKIKARIQRANWYKIPQNKIACNLRSRIRAALKGISKIDSTENLIGCTFLELKIHLEKQFKPGMSWDNYGEWHIDHIKPCSSFDLTDTEQQKACCHYSNLQPLWGNENISKGNKLQYFI